MYTVLLSERSMVKLDEVETDCHQVFANDGTKSLKLIESIFLREKNFFNLWYLSRYLYIFNKCKIILTWLGVSRLNWIDFNDSNPFVHVVVKSIDVK